MRTQIQRVGTNVAWLIGDRLLRMAVGVVVLGFVARYLGPSSFGLLNYAISLAAIFAAIASLGIEGIVIRDLVRFPDRVPEILGTALLMRLLGGMAAVVLVAGTGLIGQAGREAMPLAIIVALGFLPQSAEVIDLWFQRNIQSKFTVIAKACAIAAGAGIKIGLVMAHASVEWFAAAVAVDSLLGAVALVTIYCARKNRLSAWRPSLKMARAILHDSWPLIFSGVLVAIYARVEQVLVMNILGERSMGIYYASVRITEMWSFIPAMILSSVYPLLVEARAREPGRFAAHMQTVFDLLTGAGLLVAGVISLFGGGIIAIIYGSEYADARYILLVHAWTAPITFSGTVRAQYFLMERLTIYHTWSALIGIGVNVALGLFLMPRVGPIGAALASLIGYWVSSFVTSFLFPALRECGRMQARAFLAPLRAGEIYRTVRNRT